jgi:hypothetical protein
MQDRAYEFVQLDVFTQTPLTGNPLAIFTGARGLMGYFGLALFFRGRRRGRIFLRSERTGVHI